ncbi:hypothetical protein [Aquimarina algiphila]|uniref:hypothetical protein n=1 Tax=Aquimarina algiphila TaxID=2047982 RepID=UPI0023306253|nr:hypothetical protein [Aquimarina algiphila]
MKSNLFLKTLKEKFIIVFVFCLVAVFSCNAKILSIINLTDHNVVLHNINTDILNKEISKLSHAKSLKFKGDESFISAYTIVKNESIELASNSIANHANIPKPFFGADRENVLEEDVQLLEIADQYPSKSYNFKLKYKAKKEREIHLEIRSPENVWLGFNKVIVKKGSRKIDLAVGLVNEAIIGNGYKVIATLVPLGKDWKEKIVNNEKEFNVIPQENVDHAEMEENLEIMPLPDQKPADRYTFELKYTAKKARDIVVEIRNQRKQWLGSNKVTVPEGSETIFVTVKIPNTAEIANDYKAISLLLPVGKDWQDKIKNTSRKFNVTNGTKSASTEGVSTYIPPKEEFIELLEVPNQKKSENFTFSVEYDVNQEREIQVEIRDPQHKWLDLMSVKVSKGSGRTSVIMNVPKKIVIGSGYTATALLVPVGKDWRDKIKTSTQKFSVVRR